VATGCALGWKCWKTMRVRLLKRQYRRNQKSAALGPKLAQNESEGGA
jgi:hypothetical protein